MARTSLALALTTLAALVPFSPARAADERKVVAVLPLGSPNDHSLALMGHNAQDSFVTELVKLRRVRVVQAKVVNQTMRQHGLMLTGVIEPARLKSLGGWLKADYVVTGGLSFEGDAFVMNVHMTNVRTLETEMADDVPFRDVPNMRVAIRTAAKKISAQAAGEEYQGGRAGLFLNVDARAFYDSAEACIDTIERILDWPFVEGEVDDVDEDAKALHVESAYGRLRPGTPLEVLGDEDLEDGKRKAVIYYVKPKGGGFDAMWRKAKDTPELGDRVSNKGYRLRIAIGAIEDEVEENEELVKKYKEELYKRLDESHMFTGVEDDALQELAVSARGRKKDLLKKLFQKGIDIVVEGKFYGTAGRRRAHFKFVSTFDGEVWGEPKFETRL